MTILPPHSATPLSRAIALAAAALVAVLAVGEQAAAQRYKTDPVDSKLSRRGSIVKNVVKKGSASAEDAQLFTDYFDKYYFPAMTQADPYSLGDLGKLRADLFRQFLAPATPVFRKQLTDKAFAFANKVVRGNGYHRAVRFNGLLMLGSLTTDGVKPLPDANAFLCKVSQAASQKKVPAYMQAGALVALATHAQQLDKLPADQQTKTLIALAAATAEDTFQRDVDVSSRNWLRRSAAVSLATGAKAVGKPQAAASLADLLVDESLTLDTRAAIAASLQGLTLPNGEVAAKDMLALAKAAIEDEVEQALEFEEMQISSRSYSRNAAPIDSDRFRVNTEESRLEYIRRGLAARLANLRKGLTAVAGAAGDQADAVNTAAAAMQRVVELATSTNAVDLDITAEIKAMKDAFEGAQGNNKPAADAAPAEDEPEIEEGEQLF
ncbi:MAG: hypothetical protein AAGJ46_20515 [Planctomycetota bacterium]